MTKQSNNTLKPNPMKYVGALIPSLPFLGIKLLGNYIRFKSSAYHAGKIFEEELLKNNISPEIAEKLTQSYLNSRNIFQQAF